MAQCSVKQRHLYLDTLQTQAPIFYSKINSTRIAKLGQMFLLAWNKSDLKWIGGQQPAKLSHFNLLTLQTQAPIFDSKINSTRISKLGQMFLLAWYKSDLKWIGAQQSAKSSHFNLITLQIDSPICLRGQPYSNCKVGGKFSV